MDATTDKRITCELPVAEHRKFIESAYVHDMKRSALARVAMRYFLSLPFETRRQAIKDWFDAGREEADSGDEGCQAFTTEDGLDEQQLERLKRIHKSATEGVKKIKKKNDSIGE